MCEILIVVKKKVVAVTRTKTTHIKVGPNTYTGLYGLSKPTLKYTSLKIFDILKTETTIFQEYFKYACLGFSNNLL